MDAASAFAIEPRQPARQTARAPTTAMDIGFETLVARAVDEQPAAAEAPKREDPADTGTTNEPLRDQDGPANAPPILDVVALQAEVAPQPSAPQVTPTFALTPTPATVAPHVAAPQPAADTMAASSAATALEGTKLSPAATAPSASTFSPADLAAMLDPIATPPPQLATENEGTVVTTPSTGAPGAATPNPMPATTPQIVPTAAAPTPAAASAAPIAAQVLIEAALNAAQKAAPAADAQAPPPAALANAALAQAQNASQAGAKPPAAPVEKTKTPKANGETEVAVDTAKPANGAAKATATAAATRPAPTADSAPTLMQTSVTPPTQITPGADSLGQGGAHSATTSTAMPTTTAPASLLRPHTATHLAAQITRRFEAGQTSFEVRLDPAELGRVDVRIDMTRNRGVHASISADSALTLSELSRAAKDIERALAEAGLDLAEGGLSFSLNDPGSQDRAGDRDTSGRNSYGQAAMRTAEAELPPIGARPLSISRWAGAGLDVWA